MSDLQNQTPADTYKGLLQVGDYTNGVDPNSEYIQDGKGTNSVLSISTTKVGVGTVSPSAELDVVGGIEATTLTTSGAVTGGSVSTSGAVTGGSVSTSGAVTAGSIDVSGNVVADEYALDQTGTSSSAVAIHAPAPNELAIRTNSTEAMRIDSAGEVGIGTLFPFARLHVHDNQGADDVGDSTVRVTVPSKDDIIRLTFYADNVRSNIVQGKDSTNAADTASYIAFETRNSHPTGNGDIVERMRIDSAGNVGLGTTDPDSKLHINAEANESPTLLHLSQGSSTSEIKFTTKENDANNESVHFVQAFNDNLRFFVNGGAENDIVMTMNSAGNVGIGTVSPTAPLEVASTTGGVIMPRMTTTQRDAISSPTNGEMIYNTTTNKFQGRANGAWVDFH